MRKVKKVKYIIIAFLLWFAAVIVGGGVIVTADIVSGYTNVAEDLQKDESFNAWDYPAVPTDYKLEVIQIAESTSDELFIYVYQPSGQVANLHASSINIAGELNNDPNISFDGYGLTLCNSAGVFYKYSVDGLKISSDAVRYYNISNILRPYDGKIDDPPEEGQTISEVPNRVAQLWTAETVGDTVTYSMTTSEVVEITQKVVGFCAYDDGLDLGWGAMQGTTKAYFVAFDTDRPIDKLISADLTFCAMRSYCTVCLNSSHDHGLFYDFHDTEYIDFGTGVYNNEPLTITDKQYYGNQGGGNVRPATKFLRKRIRKTSEFIADENNKDYELVDGDKLSNTQWVLNFYEAQDKYKSDNVWLSFVPGISLINGVADGDCELNNVYDVELLRLEFETDGNYYNLGAVDNKQSGNSISSNQPTTNKQNKRAWIIAGLVIGGIVVIAIVVLSIIFPKLGEAVIAIFKGLWWLICLPFRGIAALIKSAHEHRQRKAESEKQEQSNNAKQQAKKPRKGKKKTNNRRRSN